MRSGSSFPASSIAMTRGRMTSSANLRTVSANSDSSSPRRVSGGWGSRLIDRGSYGYHAPPMNLFDDATAHEVVVDDSGDVLRRDEAVPHPLGVDQHVGGVLVAADVARGAHRDVGEPRLVARCA